MLNPLRNGWEDHAAPAPMCLYTNVFCNLRMCFRMCVCVCELLIIPISPVFTCLRRWQGDEDADGCRVPAKQIHNIDSVN